MSDDEKFMSECANAARGVQWIERLIRMVRSRDVLISEQAKRREQLEAALKRAKEQRDFWAELLSDGPDRIADFEEKQKESDAEIEAILNGNSISVVADPDMPEDKAVMLGANGTKVVFTGLTKKGPSDAK